MQPCTLISVLKTININEIVKIASVREDAFLEMHFCLLPCSEEGITLLRCPAAMPMLGEQFVMETIQG